MDQPVQNAVGQGRGADLLMPALDRDLAVEDRRVQLVAIFANFQEVAALRFRPGALAQSSTTSRSSLAKRARKLLMLPSARAKAKSRNSLGARRKKAVNPSRQAFSAKAQASQVFPTPHGPNQKTF